MKFQSRRILISLLGALLIASFGVACGETNEGTPEPGLVECTWDESPVDWDEEAPNGITADVFLDELDAEKEQEIQGKDPAGEDLLFTVQFTRHGDKAIFYSEKEGGCGDKFVIPGTFVLKTADGRLDEELEVDAEVQGESLKLSKTLKKEELEGSFEPNLRDEEKFLRFSFDATIKKAGISGYFGTEIEVSSGSGSDASVSAGPGEVFEF